MLKKFDGLLSVIETWFMVSLFLLGLALATLQVVLRYVFNTGIHWLEAGLVTALIWAMLFGAVRAVRDGFHPRVDLVPSLASPKVRAVLNFIGIGSAFALSTYVLIDAVFYAKFINMINVLHPELEIKMVYPFLIVPIMAALMTLRYALVLYTLCFNPSATSPDGQYRDHIGAKPTKGVVE
ncbi:hypothetical protein GCM10007939_13650 [Amylibacter marinus]|uniref:TRAP transporter small permease protein n=1 Tax=Amylibacter marinus TaxID=1475483 RepID=A0ABQ5VUG8_9RHOB|nr:TRAP transporter small permease [Amylibacter marinus]GLQ35082.1 hypothetical protein GCM10007939_13650 [Amylibacter marinus]